MRRPHEVNRQRANNYYRTCTSRGNRKHSHNISDALATTSCDVFPDDRHLIQKGGGTCHGFCADSGGGGDVQGEDHSSLGTGKDPDKVEGSERHIPILYFAGLDEDSDWLVVLANGHLGSKLDK